MNRLKFEEKEQFFCYQRKWQESTLSTEPIDKDKAIKAVKDLYDLIGYREPKIVFSESPYRIIDVVFQAGVSSLGNKLDGKIDDCLLKPLRHLTQSVRREIEDPSWSLLEGQSWHSKGSQIDRSLLVQPAFNLLYSVATPGNWVRDASVFDFCFSALKQPSDRERWELFRSLMANVAWLYPFENACIACDRPVKLSVDREGELHAEGEPAVQFADGCSLYSYHGITLPEKYGKVHPQDWQSVWLLEEVNAELKRVLIQGIGYVRMAQELHAQELDNWREYTLLQIDIEWVDIEPIYLLKMICPSTGFIHALRVPPEVRSAREAISWVNWETDPEEFSVQT